jgi:MFS family permease
MPEETPTPPAANVRTVFAGLMLGMFLAAMNQTIITPAMPRIVAELGGMRHYSWIAVSALLASTVIVPIVGKLSDLLWPQGVPRRRDPGLPRPGSESASGPWSRTKGRDPPRSLLPAI